MSGIDWYKAPSWATKYGMAGPQVLRCWFNDEQYVYADDVHHQPMRFGDQSAFARDRGQFTVIAERPSSPAWSGPQDGLPPVGCMVRIVDNGSLRYGVGEEGPVVAHVEDCAVVRMSYGLGCFEASVLAPALTPEQIALEQQNKAVAEMMTHVVHATAYDCQLLYCAGYRKQEQPK